MAAALRQRRHPNRPPTGSRPDRPPLRNSGRRALWDNYSQKIPAGHDTVVHARPGFLSACPVHGAGLPGHC
jgi:hypothetical protein